MAKMVNVNRSVQDPFYRYQMPRIVAKVEGKGNGIKTVIVNMSDIAKALSRPPTYPTKYFGCELGAQTNFDLKNDRYIVNGEHDANKLQDILDGFIKKFVLCPSCENPETTLKVRRQGINSKCKACGHAFTIDPKHKISTFILKNPPPSESSEETKDQRNGGENSPAEEVEKTEDDFEPNGKASNSDENNDDDWMPELDHEKLDARIQTLVINRDLEKSVEERLDLLHQYFVKAKESDTLGDGKQLLNEAERLDLKNKAPLLLAQTLFTRDGILDELKSYRTIFLRFCLDSKKAQRCLLGGIEIFLEKHQDLLSRAPHIIKALYDLDLCTEESILSWGSKANSKYINKNVSREILKKCEPIFEWLKNAEEETESEEEDENVVEFNERSRVIGTVIEQKVPKKAVAVVEDTEDLDIDAI